MDEPDTRKVNTRPAPKAATPDNYAGSYSNRLRYFGSTSRFNYGNYQPVLVPTITYNPYSGWHTGMTVGYGFNSPFSPYYGCTMPYTDPFYAYGWGSSWMMYNPYYIYNPYMYAYNPYSFGGYGCYGYGGMYYNNYNPYVWNNFNSNTTGTGVNYGRRTGGTTPTTTTNTNNQNTTTTDRNNWWNSGSNSGNSSSGNSSSGSGSGGGWWNNSSTGSGGDRTPPSGGGSTNGSTRRR